LIEVYNFIVGTIWGNMLFGYLIGSIPFGLILCALAGYGDVRRIGSGNIGATNVLRTGNKLLALLTVLLDAGKGIAAFALMYVMLGLLPACEVVSCLVDSPCPCALVPIEEHAFVATVSAFSAVIGHMFPIWLKFQGGKGVATSFGALLAATPITGALVFVTWIVSAMASRISSLAALSAAFIAPAVSYIFYGTEVALMNAGLSVLVWVRHKDNIQRLLKGEEPKIGDKKKQSMGEADNEPSSPA